MSEHDRRMLGGLLRIIGVGLLAVVVFAVGMTMKHGFPLVVSRVVVFGFVGLVAAIASEVLDPIAT